MAKWIELDGAEGEGGGQILRSALTLSLITQQPFLLSNVRANRDKPGLRAQHLECVDAAARLCDAETDGARLNSNTLRFRPGRQVSAGDYRFRIGTAGSTMLLFQTILLPLSFSGGNSSVTLEGGTHNDKAPSFDFITQHFLPVARMMGLDFGLSLSRPGFYPKGGGIVSAFIPETSLAALKGLSWNGDKPLRKLSASVLVFLAGGIPSHVHDREVAQVNAFFAKRGLPKPLRLSQPRCDEPKNPGNALLLMAEWLDDSQQTIARGAAQAIGARGKRAEQVADDALREFAELLDQPEATIDEHLADQLMLPATLAAAHSGASMSVRPTRISNHIRTNAGVLTRFVPAAAIDIDEERKTMTIRRAR